MIYSDEVIVMSLGRVAPYPVWKWTEPNSVEAIDCSHFRLDLGALSCDEFLRAKRSFSRVRSQAGFAAAKGNERVCRALSARCVLGWFVYQGRVPLARVAGRLWRGRRLRFWRCGSMERARFLW